MARRKDYWMFRIIRGAVKLCYPKIRVEGLENLPAEPAILVGNHCQMHGPITAELYAPAPSFTWCAGQMMELKEVPAYAFTDFWSGKPKSVRWLYRIFSYLIAPLSVCVFNNAATIGVYHDTRVLSTFKKTVQRLSEGANVVIFPEHAQPYNHIVCDFQTHFIDVAKLYYKRTGKALSFVPMYLAPKLKTAYLGKPVVFDPDAPIDAEREHIAEYLMDEITEMACSLPEHTVVPYLNVPKREYPKNTDCNDSRS